MKNLITHYESLIKLIDEEIEMNGLRSVNFESWLKGIKKSYEVIIRTIKENKEKEQLIGEIEIRIIMSDIALEGAETEAIKSYLEGLLHGYKQSLPHIEKYIL
jgi:hypothetical protein